jgi:hypothetical protein
VRRHELFVPWRRVHTGGVASKYDGYWAARLEEIQVALGDAASGSPAAITVRGLQDLGDRLSWYGLAEVRAGQLTRCSMAHAASLGKAVAASRICAPWPGETFRLLISAAGDTLTITAVHPDSRPGEAVLRRPEHRPAAASAPGSESAPGTRAAAPPGGARVGTGRAGTGEFYRLLAEVAGLAGGVRRLRDCRAADCPRAGVYFFFEDGEVRGDGSSRVIRIGTHALTAVSKATLWDRLRQHRGHLAGRAPGSGSHRASVFRRHVGTALIRRDGQPPGLLESWLDRHGPRPGWDDQETAVEVAVSCHIGAMPVLWLTVPDPVTRGYVERNSIVLTSQLAAGQDRPSPGWLGRHAVPGEVRQSGLWNVEHVTSSCDPGFLAVFEQLIRH